MVADCLPVFFTDVEGRFVAAAHAGWRGLADGVLRQNIESIHALAGVNIAYSAIKIIAWLGPCIGPTAFEVGAEVKAEFAAKLVGSAPFFTQTGQPRIRQIRQMAGRFGWLGAAAIEAAGAG